MNKARLTIKSYGVERTITIPQDSDIHEYLEVIISLLLACGFSKETIENGIKELEI